MDVIAKALEFEKTSLKSLSTNDRVKLSREVKAHILALNEIYKKNKDSEVMDLMKRLTAMKKKIEKRLLKVPIV